MNHHEQPTMPPGPADEACDAFAARVERLERLRPQRTASGVLRLVAEAWAHVTSPAKGE